MSKNTQWSPAFRYVMGVIYFLAFAAFVVYAGDAVRNLIVAAFVAYLINPAVVYLTERTKMTRFTAVNVVYFSSLILLVGVPATLAPIFYDELQIVIQDLLDITGQLSAALMEPVRLGGLVFHLEEWGRSLSQVQGDVLTPLPEEALLWLETTSVGFLWFLIILVSVYLFLSEWHRMRDNLFALVLPPYRAEAEELYKRIRRVWRAYLRGQIVLMIIVGVVFTIVWLIMGIPGALVLGVIAGLFTLVPEVGPFVAVTLAAGVALLEGSRFGVLAGLPNFWVAAIVILVYLVLINLKNFFLRPIIMGRSVHMNEALIFIVIVIATILEGILGALLVVPAVASIVVIAGYIQRKLLGLPGFEDDGSQQFVAPPEVIKPRRKWTKKERQQYRGGLHASNHPEPAASSPVESQPRMNPAQKKIRK
jgi:predicted PurR-regulated permease PerM